jgi:5-methyltetrahydrofolate--homocysteine methyltransferase
MADSPLKIVYCTPAIYSAGGVERVVTMKASYFSENYGYDVIDLGKDVPPEAIVDRAIEDDVKLIGLSALMTTTVVSMEDTIKLLREKKPDTKVVVGGAVMTQEYADAIGAGCYAKDAMATVRYADEVFAKELYCHITR